MQSVFRTLEAFSGNKNLSTLTEIIIRKFEIHRSQSINIVPQHQNQNSDENTTEKKHRPVMIGKRTLPSRRWIETNIGKVKRIGQQSLRNVFEPAKNERSMEIDEREKLKTEVNETLRMLFAKDDEGIVSSGAGFGENRIENDTKEIIKDMWKDALWRRLKLEGKNLRHWDSEEKWVELLATCSQDERLQRRYEKLFP